MHVNFLVLKSSNRSQKNMKSNNTINRTSIVEGIYRWFIKKWYFFSTCQTDTAIKINNKRSQGNLVSWLWTKCVCRNKQQKIFFFFFCCEMFGFYGNSTITKPITSKQKLLATFYYKQTDKKLQEMKILKCNI